MSMREYVTQTSVNMIKYLTANLSARDKRQASDKQSLTTSSGTNRGKADLLTN